MSNPARVLHIPSVFRPLVLLVLRALASYVQVVELGSLGYELLMYLVAILRLVNRSSLQNPLDARQVIWPLMTDSPNKHRGACQVNLDGWKS